MNHTAEFWDDVYLRPHIAAAAHRIIRSVADVDETYGGNDRFRVFELLDPQPEDVILDCGCGDGDWTILFASKGAKVTAIDQSHNAIELLRQRLRSANLDAELIAGDLTQIPVEDGRFTKIFGSLILHHLHDFTGIGHELARVLKPGGKAVFWENSANNPFFMFGRNHLVGRYGIPKYGDADEHPLRIESIRELGRQFGGFRVIINQCVFFRVFQTYILRDKFPRLKKLCFWLDEQMQKTPLRKWGYLQIVEFTKA